MLSFVSLHSLVEKKGLAGLTSVGADPELLVISLEKRRGRKMEPISKSYHKKNAKMFTKLAYLEK